LGFGFPWILTRVSSWFNTNAFYQFAANEIGSLAFSYSNPPQYVRGQPYGQNKNDKDWQDRLLAVRGSIQKGDLVFYGRSENDWDHVAVVVGWGLPTAFGLKEIPGSGPSGTEASDEMEEWIRSLECYAGFPPSLPIRPIVAERSGVIAYTSWRSLDNTSSQIDLIQIIHIKD